MSAADRQDVGCPDPAFVVETRDETRTLYAICSKNFSIEMFIEEYLLYEV